MKPVIELEPFAYKCFVLKVVNNKLKQIARCFDDEDCSHDFNEWVKVRLE